MEVVKGTEVDRKLASEFPKGKAVSDTFSEDNRAYPAKSLGINSPWVEGQEEQCLDHTETFWH